MGLREDLEAWNASIPNPTVSSTISGGGIDLGQVNDTLYYERKLAMNPFLGIVENAIDDIVTLDYNASSMKVQIHNDINTIVEVT